MEDAEAPASPKPDELVEIIREVRERVRSRYPGAAPGGVALPDLVGILQARDAAEAKVAAIGTVNPRRPGPFNALIQACKRLVARALDWHVREQVEFNRASVNAIDAILGALNENNRALRRLAAADAANQDQIQRYSQALQESEQRLADTSSHWSQWREEWEQKLTSSEIQHLRSVADLQGALQHRATLMESDLRERLRAQHSDFSSALERTSLEIQKRLSDDLERIRTEYERLIHSELRLVRRRLTIAAAERPAAAAPPAMPAVPDFDALDFAERFRGTEEHVRETMRWYVPRFQGHAAVVDLGCGRGEFLELMRDAGIAARGVDLSEECVALCRSKGLDAQRADLFELLSSVAEGSLDGIFTAHVIEHLPAERIPELIRLAASRLCSNGLLVIETPNPESLAALAMYFYLDPTHQSPLPPALLRFYLEESGFGGIEVHRLSPAVDSVASLRSLDEDLREALFGGLDYAILGWKL